MADNLEDSKSDDEKEELVPSLSVEDEKKEGAGTPLPLDFHMLTPSSRKRYYGEKGEPPPARIRTPRNSISVPAPRIRLPVVAKKGGSQKLKGPDSGGPDPPAGPIVISEKVAAFLEAVTSPLQRFWLADPDDDLKTGNDYSWPGVAPHPPLNGSHSTPSDGTPGESTPRETKPPVPASGTEALKRESTSGDTVDENKSAPEVPKMGKRESVQLQKPQRMMPTDVLRHILTFMHDDELFRLRVLCGFAYKTYLHQEIGLENRKKFNSVRAVRLAAKGRVFSRVGVLRFNNDDHPLSDKDLQAVNTKSFPRLYWLKLYGEEILTNTSLQKLPVLPNVAKLTVSLWHKPADCDYITEERFPNLEKLLINASELTILQPHSKLKELLLPDFAVTEGTSCVDRAHGLVMDRRKFPGLQLVRVWGHENMPRLHERLAEFCDENGVVLEVAF